MLITLTEKEIMEAVAKYIGDSYEIHKSKFIAGRAGSGNRLELDVEKVNVIEPIIKEEVIEDVPNVVEEVDVPPFEPDEPNKSDGPIFSKID